ncbi:MAG: hypothetical protein IJ014_02165 [Rikenellaceae bacterium]|nr:hypothetical protein [Rikenellaceae bacterium]
MTEQLKKDIARLSMLVDGWDGGMSALERELFLETLRRMYEKVRFADTAAEIPSATVASAAVASAAALADDEPSDEPDIEIELVMDEDAEECAEEDSPVVVPVPAPEVEEEPAPQIEEPAPEEAATPVAEPAPIEPTSEVVAEPVEVTTPEKAEPAPVAEPSHVRPKISRQVIDTLYGDGALPKVTPAAPVAESAPAPQSESPAPINEVSTPQPTPQPAATVAEPSVADVVGAPKTVLGDVINTGAVRLGDSFQTDTLDVATKIAAGEVRSLRGAMGINDKVMIMRDLFGGDAAQFDAVINELDRQPSFDDAMIYISEYSWNSSSEGAKMLMNLLKLKFS